MSRYLIAILILSLGACSSDGTELYDDHGSPSVDQGVDGAPMPSDTGHDSRGHDIVRPDLVASDLFTPDTSAPDLSPPPACVATICMEGAYTHETGGNPDFGDLCRQIPGLIEECAGAACYPRFGMWSSDAALDALISKLDQNGDGRYDEADPLCEVRILGYSWGGVNAAQVAERFVTDARVAATRWVVHKLILIDPYIPLSEVRVVEGVKSFWEYRHTVAPAGDCSSGAVMGPYFGIPPACHASVHCVDYDYSLAPNQSFNGLLGAEVGHCSIVEAAKASILHNMRVGTDDPAAPPSVAVALF